MYFFILLKSVWSHLNSLQSFVEEVLCLSGGKWSSPGGDTKLYKNQDLSIEWYTKSFNIVAN